MSLLPGQCSNCGAMPGDLHPANCPSGAIRSRPVEQPARGEAVGWQVRHHGDNGFVSQWNHCHDGADRPERSGRFRCEYRPLYTAPPQPGVDRERLLALIRGHLNNDIPLAVQSWRDREAEARLPDFLALLNGEK